MAQEAYLIAGLGNPGLQYRDTRHNIGFMVINALCNHYGVVADRSKWDALYTRTTRKGLNLFLIMPQTFMNLSGRSVSGFADFYKIPRDHILVCHDDLDMHPGRLKLVAGGGPGGHNGIRSLIQCLGGKNFFRLKYGIGKPGENETHQNMPVEKYVLANLGKDEQKLLDTRMEQIVEGVDLFLDSGCDQAMNLLNSVK